jgi:Glycosyl transferase family 2
MTVLANSPKVSVIVSVYEQLQFLPRMLASLAYQDYEGEWELLICDDGSATDMLLLIKEFSKRTTCEVRYLWQTDRGFRVARSRNNAIKCSGGDVLVFLDGDVVVEPDLVRRHAEAHGTTRQLVCGSRSYIFLKAHPDLAWNTLLTVDGAHEIKRHASFPTTPFQRARLKSHTPWFCICGCNFSVWKTPDVRFAEEFVGWGLEDCELALHLTARSGFTMKCLFDNMAYHLEESSPATFHPCRPETHDEISAYIRNMVRLDEQYQDQDLNELWQIVAGFELDKMAHCWQRRRETWRPRVGVAETARRWVLDNQPLAGHACAAEIKD